MNDETRPENETLEKAPEEELEKKPVEKDYGKFKIQANYSPEAIEKKTLKFITPGGEWFEIAGEELAAIMMGTVNSELIAASFVESDRVNVVDVMRQIRVRSDRNIKKGEEIRLDYTHPYPLEFAIIEEAAKVAKIKMDVPMRELTAEYIKKVEKKITPKQRKFVDRVLAFYKNLKTNRAERRANKTASAP